MKLAAQSGKQQATVSPEEIRQTLAKIAHSKYFAHAPKKQKFVQVICEYYLQGRAAELNEYLLGCEVFDKGAAYHPAADPVVRVSAHDVRKKLELYYQHEGADDPVRLTIPVGTYMPVFSRTPTLSEAKKEVILPSRTGIEITDRPTPTKETFTNPSSSPSAKLAPMLGASLFALAERRLVYSAKKILLLAGMVILVLSAGILWLVSQNRTLQQRARGIGGQTGTDQELKNGIWEPFLTNQFPALLVLSNPVVYRTVNGADPDVIVKKGISLTSEQANLLANISNDRLPMRANRPMQLIPAFNMYTGIGEAIGVFRLQGLLQGVGEAALLKQSRNVGADDLKDHDAILLGSVYANQWAKPLSIKENFIYTTRTSIENLAPREGEQREYVSQFEQRTGALIEDYAIISVVPGVSGTNAVMSLSGIYSEGTQAAVEYVTDKTHLAELNQKLHELAGKGAKPRYFQALLKVRVENSFPTQIILLTVREL